MNTNVPLPSGVWSYPDKEHPDHPFIEWIDAARRRIVIFFVRTVREPHKRGMGRLWYEPESTTSIRIRLKPNASERVQQFRLAPDQLVWIHPGYSDQLGKRLSPEEYPEWLEEKVAAAFAKMDEAERQAVQSKTE